jgi:hypothetical protein
MKMRLFCFAQWMECDQNYSFDNALAEMEEYCLWAVLSSNSERSDLKFEA